METLLPQSKYLLALTFYCDWNGQRALNELLGLLYYVCFITGMLNWVLEMNYSKLTRTDKCLNIEMKTNSPCAN